MRNFLLKLTFLLSCFLSFKVTAQNSERPLDSQLLLPTFDHRADLDIFEGFRQHDMNYINALHDRLEIFFSAQGGQSSEASLVELIRFGQRIDGELNNIDQAAANQSAFKFENLMGRLMKNGLLDGRYSLAGLARVAKESRSVFLSGGDFYNWLTHTYVREKLATAQETEKREILSSTRDLVFRLYQGSPTTVQHFNRGFHSELWDYVYQDGGAEFQNLMRDLGPTTGVANSLNGPRPFVSIQGFEAFDIPTQLYFLDKIIQASNNPHEILEAIEKTQTRLLRHKSRFFPRYETFTTSMSRSGDPTLQLNPVERIGVFFKKDLVHLPLGIAAGLAAVAIIAPFWIPSKMMDLAFKDKDSEGSKNAVFSGSEIRNAFWSLSLKGWKKIKEIEPADYSNWRPSFRNAAQLSDSRGIFFRCGSVVRALKPFRGPSVILND